MSAPVALPPRSIERTRILSWGMLAIVVATSAIMALSVRWKLLCSGPTFGPTGGTELEIQRYGRFFCYTDLRSLFAAREMFDHALPYVGSYAPDGGLTGGVVEYPVLSGVFLWLMSLPVSSDWGFVLVAGTALAVCSVVVSFLLYAMIGRRAWLWALAPGVAAYTVYNVDVLPVLFTVVGLAVMLWSGDRLSFLTRAYLAAIAFGIGGALKLYPLLFALPVAIWAALRVREERSRFGWGTLVGVLAVAGGVVIVSNLPFAIFATEGWLASFEFQSNRLIENNTMALWWWVPHLLGYEVSGYTDQLTVVAAVFTAAGLAVAVAWGFRAVRRGGRYPWLEVSAAMLIAFMVLNKVHSPQYILWLIPFLVLVRIPVRWILVYYATDLAIFFGSFRPFLLVPEGRPTQGVEALLAMGVILRAAVLAYLFVLFLRAADATADAPAAVGSSDPATDGAGGPAPAPHARSEHDDSAAVNAEEAAEPSR